MTRVEIENEALKAEVRRTRSELAGLQARIQRLIEELAADVQRGKDVAQDAEASPGIREYAQNAAWKAEWLLRRTVEALHGNEDKP